MIRKLLVLLPLLMLAFVSSVNAQSANSTKTSQFVPVPAVMSTQNATDAATKLKLQRQLIQDQKREALVKAKNEFKAKLQLIKDQKKKALVERIDAKIAAANKKQTDRFLEVLTHLQRFLDKINQIATGATALTGIATAQTAIETAKTAVEAQAAKDYTMSVVDDSTLKLNAGAIVSQFRLDLVAVYKQVVDAKQAVQKLNTEKSIIKKEATRSAEI